MTLNVASQKLPASSFESLEAAIKRLAENKSRWLEQDIKTRIGFLKQCQKALGDLGEEWVRSSCRGKGIPEDSHLAGEEWLAGMSSCHRYLTMTIKALKAKGKPKPRALFQRDSGQYVAEVFPASLLDKLFMSGVTAEVWIQPGKPPTQGEIYREQTHNGKLCAVLGAGNQSSIPVLDVLYKLFAENEVVILKMNPVNEYLGPLIEKAFASLIEKNFLAVCYGGADVGSYLCYHKEVDSVHITGSIYSHDAIVWGADAAEREQRKAKNDPLLKKRITSELGCVTPILIVPGQWSDKDIAFQAEHVAGMVVNNGSFNCNAAKVIVTARDWPQREAFLAKFREELGKIPPRTAYYPGARDRHSTFLAKYPKAKILSANAPENTVPWTYIPNVPPIKAEYALSVEAFCGVVAEVAVDAFDAKSFLTEAVDFVNDSVSGTLSCGIFIDPATEEACKKEFEEALSRLRYGGIAVNAWPAVIYWLMSPTWGAYPGHTIQEAGSGIGYVHNGFMFDYPEKSIVRVPFRMWPKPPWFATHKNVLQLGKAAAEFSEAPGYFNFVKLALAAVKG